MKSKTQDCLADFPRKKMYGFARKYAPNRPDLWDDMVQDGYKFLLTAVDSWDGRQSFGAYTHGFLRSQMKRAMHAEICHDFGILKSDVREYREVPKARVPLSRHYNGCQLPEAASADETPEQSMLAREQQWVVRKAVWDTVADKNIASSPWMYKTVRDMVLSNRATAKDVGDRYGKAQSTVYTFIRRVQADVRKRLEAVA